MGKAYNPIGVPMTESQRGLLYQDELEAFKRCKMDCLTREDGHILWDNTEDPLECTEKGCD